MMTTDYLKEFSDQELTVLLNLTREKYFKLDMKIENLQVITQTSKLIDLIQREIDSRKPADGV